MTISQFKFDSYKILKSHIDISESYEGDGKGLELKFKVSGVVKQAENQFELNLQLVVRDKENTLSIDIETRGYFKYEPMEEITDMGNFFYMNSSAILFPYIRAYISTLSALSAIKTITLPTMNLTNLASELRENTIFN